MKVNLTNTFRTWHPNLQLSQRQKNNQIRILRDIISTHYRHRRPLRRESLQRNWIWLCNLLNHLAKSNSRLRTRSYILSAFSSVKKSSWRRSKRGSQNVWNIYSVILVAAEGLAVRNLILKRSQWYSRKKLMTRDMNRLESFWKPYKRLMSGLGIHNTILINTIKKNWWYNFRTKHSVQRPYA